jgi:hypothetical protein
VLTSLPGGASQLASYVRAIPTSTGDPVADLRRRFPALGETDGQLEKWWALSLAKLSISDRYRGLSLPETVKRLDPLLTIDIPLAIERPKARRSKKASEPVAAVAVPAADALPIKTFPLASFPEYLKLRGSQEVLSQQAGKFLELETLASPLLKPAIAQYRVCVTQLAQGHTTGVAARMADADGYRQLVLKRLDAIADYLNWFEGTQTKTRSTLFDNYLRDAKALSAPAAHAPTAITRYLDVMEQQLR